MYTGSSYLVTTTYIFTDTGIIELNPGNYWDESQPEFYNNSIYNFKMRDDGKLGYIRRPYKALQSVDISGQLQYVVSRDEFGKEEGYVTIENGEVIYHPEKTYTISEIYDFDGMFEQWLEYSSTQGDVSLEGYGLLGKVKTLDEYFEQNSLRYKPATFQPVTVPIPEINEADYVVKDGVLTSYVGTSIVVNIPDTVKEIAANAFANSPVASSITEINIGANVEEISTEAFENLPNLKRVNVADANPKYRQINIFNSSNRDGSSHSRYWAWFKEGVDAAIYRKDNFALPMELNSIPTNSPDEVVTVLCDGAELKISFIETQSTEKYAAQLHSIKYGEQVLDFDDPLPLKGNFLVYSYNFAEGYVFARRTSADSGYIFTKDGIITTPNARTHGAITLSCDEIGNLIYHKENVEFASDRLQTADPFSSIITGPDYYFGEDGRVEIVNGELVFITEVTYTVEDFINSQGMTMEEWFERFALFNPGSLEELYQFNKENPYDWWKSRRVYYDTTVDFRLWGYNGEDTVLNLPTAIKSIDDNAFSNSPAADKITEINIGPNVEKISINAFAGLPSLVKVNIDPANPYFTSDGKNITSADGSFSITIRTSAVTEPPVTEPPATEPPATEPPVTKPVETFAPTPVPTGDYKFYREWHAPQSYYSKTGNKYVSAVVSNNRNSVFITAEKTGTLCWYYAVSDHEIPSARDFRPISAYMATPQKMYDDFKVAFEKIKNKKYEQEMEAKNTVKVDLDGYLAVVIALRDEKGNYSECLTIRNPGLDMDYGANMDTEGILYSDDAIRRISETYSLKFKAESKGKVYARIYFDNDEYLERLKEYGIEDNSFSNRLTYWGLDKGASNTFDYVLVSKGNEFTLKLDYTVAYYALISGYYVGIDEDGRIDSITSENIEKEINYEIERYADGSLSKNYLRKISSIKQINYYHYTIQRSGIISDGVLQTTDFSGEERTDMLKSLYLCIQLVDGDNFYKPIVIRFDELIKAE